LRRILRRAVRQGKVFGMNEPFLYKLVDNVHSIMAYAYPELTARLDNIKSMVKVEEEKFLETLNTGTDILNNLITDYKNKKNFVINGNDVFKLYDSTGSLMNLQKKLPGKRTFDRRKVFEEEKRKLRKIKRSLEGSGEQDITFIQFCIKKPEIRILKVMKNAL
jgi:alanyl-tRNA synthetase